MVICTAPVPWYNRFSSFLLVINHNSLLNTNASRFNNQHHCKSQIPFEIYKVGCTANFDGV